MSNVPFQSGDKVVCVDDSSSPNAWWPLKVHRDLVYTVEHCWETLGGNTRYAVRLVGEPVITIPDRPSVVSGWRHDRFRRIRTEPETTTISNEQEAEASR